MRLSVGPAEPLRQRLRVGCEFGIPDDLAVSRACGMAALVRVKWHATPQPKVPAGRWTGGRSSLLSHHARRADTTGGMHADRAAAPGALIYGLSGRTSPNYAVPPPADVARVLARASLRLAVATGEAVSARALRTLDLSAPG
jgi:hypothetical protein